MFMKVVKYAAYNADKNLYRYIYVCEKRQSCDENPLNIHACCCLLRVYVYTYKWDSFSFIRFYKAKNDIGNSEAYIDKWWSYMCMYFILGEQKG